MIDLKLVAYVGIEIEDRNLEANMEFFAFFIFVACDDLLDVWQRSLENCQSFSIVRSIYECNLISYITFILFADTYTERVKVTK